MDFNWRLRSACLDVPVEKATYGDASGTDLLKFIAECCSSCSVVKQCWDSRIVETDKGVFDDNEWTIRGGQLPTKSSGQNRGRPKGSSSNKVATFKEQNQDEYLNVLLRWSTYHPNGECVNGHVITDEFTQLRIRFRDGSPTASCKKCDYSRIDRAKKGKRKKPPPLTHCRNGHEYTPENTRLQSRMEQGVYREYRRCKACHDASSKASYDRGKIAA